MALEASFVDHFYSAVDHPTSDNDKADDVTLENIIWRSKHEHYNPVREKASEIEISTKGRSSIVDG